MPFEALSVRGEYLDSDRFLQQRLDMVTLQLERRGIRSQQVLSVMRATPRHLFVPEDFIDRAYFDTPLPLAAASTISQPYIVAYMLEKLCLQDSDRVLEIGTGSGYQTALLAQLVAEVYSIEIEARLVKQAMKNLKQKDLQQEVGTLKNIQVKVGDGHLGWSEKAPFNKIIISAACNSIPRDLVAQLADGGRMILPLGSLPQYLVMLEKQGPHIETTELCAVSFVPLR